MTQQVLDLVKKLTLTSSYMIFYPSTINTGEHGSRNIDKNKDDEVGYQPEPQQ